MTPLHICRNAFKIDNKCVYAVCSICHFSMKRKPPATRGGERDNDKSLCDHNNLELLTDEGYVQGEYLQRCLDSGKHVPVRCSVCKHYFTTNKKLVK